MSELDQYCAAKLLMRRYGRDTKVHVMRQVLNMRAAEHFVGEWAWLCVFDAVLDLEENEPGSGQTVH